MRTNPIDIIKFGTDGWRAVISDQFTFENVQIVIQAIADYIIAKNPSPKGIVVGYDNRFLGKDFARVAAEVLVANQIPVILAQKSYPTPLISFAAKHFDLDGGIMITASHNPAEYNGVKFKMPAGCSADPETTKEFEHLICKNVVKTKDLQQAENLVSTIDLEKPYLDWVKQYINFDIIKQKKYTILVDSMYGVGKSYIADLLKETDHKVITIRNEHNPAFGGIAPEPVPKNMQATVDALKKYNADVALVTDGDADRLAALDSNCEYIITPKIATLMAMHMLKNRGLTGSVIKTLSCSVVLDRFAQKNNLEILEKPVGFKHIVPYLLNQKALIGTEESGGLGVKGHIPERDGILCGLLFIEALAGLGFDNSAQAMQFLDNQFGKLRYNRIDCHITPEQKEAFLSKVNTNPPQKILGKKIVNIKKYDGIKFECEDDSWLLLRFSGTEPVVRFYAEASTSKEAIALTDFGRDFLD